VLSDYEREVLYEIQRRLLVEDPSFARSFDTDAKRLHRGSPDLVERTYTISLVVSLAIVVILLAVRAPAGALLVAAVAAVIWEVRQRRMDRP
jgi:Flp pilus assembly protein TadB